MPYKREEKIAELLKKLHALSNEYYPLIIKEQDGNVIFDGEKNIEFMKKQVELITDFYTKNELTSICAEDIELLLLRERCAAQIPLLGLLELSKKIIELLKQKGDKK